MGEKKFAVTIFGATGFTGKFIAEELSKKWSTFALDSRAQWAIAGRDESKLRALAATLTPSPAVVLADIKDSASLSRMCDDTFLVLSCVGPYALLGESVVEACIASSERSQAACDYADLCGEPGFIESCHLKYHKRAAAAGACILHAAGFDSVPADCGVQEAKRAMLARGATPSSVEMFFRLHLDPKLGFQIHYATYAAAVNGFANRESLAATRRALRNERPPPAKTHAATLGVSEGLPRRRGPFGLPIIYAPDQRSYLIPFFFADPAIIRLSQVLAAELGTGEPSIKLQAWILVPSLPILLLALPMLTLFGILSTFAAGRAVLLRYPGVFSAGLVSHDGPSAQQLAASGFTTSFTTRGFSSSARSPDVTQHSYVHGPEVGYVTTPIVMVQTARVMLTQRDKLRHGVLTPAAALGKTSIVSDLNADGRVVFAQAQSDANQPR